MVIDFLARNGYYIPHMAPIWNAMPSGLRGVFYVIPEKCDFEVKKYLKDPHLVEYHDIGEGPGDCGNNPIVTAGYGDAVRAADWDRGRPTIMLEHGVGLTFGKNEYADGAGQRVKFSLIPVQSKYIFGKIHPDVKHIPHPVIGIPKLDKWAGWNGQPTLMANDKESVIAIGFHHGNQYSRPGVVGSAFEHYQNILPQLAKQYKMIGYGHPIAMAQEGLRKAFMDAGIEIVEDFDDVMMRADILINDASSAAYEFLLTGRPVILLNAPWFDKKQNWGLRFWEYTNIGLQVDEPALLSQAIDRTILNPDEFIAQRRIAVNDLFPYVGRATDKAIEEILSFVNKNSKRTAPVATRDVAPIPEPVAAPVAIPAHKANRKSDDRGLVYMCFGEAALRELTKSITSLRSVGSDLPVCVLGDKDTLAALHERLANEIFAVIPWDGQNPYDASRAQNFQFRAGRVKPFLYGLSPFVQSMYVDADVEFMVDPEMGFGFLDHWDFAVAQERVAVGELYNIERAGWQHNLEERDFTVKAYGGDGNFPFVNSGVLFWKRNKAVEGLFHLWNEEWMRFQQWDEQLSLMRAMNRAKAKVLVLSERWNHPHREDGLQNIPGANLILHKYGRGAARVNINNESANPES